MNPEIKAWGNLSLSVILLVISIVLIYYYSKLPERSGQDIIDLENREIKLASELRSLKN